MNGMTTPEKPRAPDAASEPLARAGWRRRRIIGWSMLAAGGLILLGTAWVGWQGYQAYSHLQAASTQVSELQGELKNLTTVDGAATNWTIVELQVQAAAARSAVDDPVFAAATHLPFLGANLGAIREVAVTVDSLATEVMPALVGIADTLQSPQLVPSASEPAPSTGEAQPATGELASSSGGINLAPIEEIAPLLQRADNAVDRAVAQIAAIDRSALVQPVSDAVLTLERKLDQASEVTEPAAVAARLLPPMLGADTLRTYLVVFQNPAEPRATGGMFGSFAVVTVDQGKIAIVDQGASSRTLGIFDPPIDGLTDAQQALYTDEMARFPLDVNFTPDFPTAAKLFSRMYHERGGGQVDGVIAIDPVALSYMLRGSPPIDVGEGLAVTADNLVPTLLSTAYKTFDEWDQSRRDDFLSVATAKVFETIMTDASAPAILDGLRKAIGERRVLVYSANSVEQTDISATSLAGELSTDPAAPSIGVFLNDGTGAKLGYYLSNEVHVVPGQCRADGVRELQVNITMHYSAPASGLPAYVLGSGSIGKAYTLRTNVMVFAPVGGGFGTTVSRDGVPIGAAAAIDLSRQLAIATVDLTPGASTDLTFTVLTAPGRGDQLSPIRPELVLTPGVKPWVTSVDKYDACGMSTS